MDKAAYRFWSLMLTPSSMLLVRLFVLHCYYCRRWYADNNGAVFSCADTAYILAFSLMMLNTDMYNRSLKEGEKMTVEQFCNNNRGIDQGQVCVIYICLTANKFASLNLNI
jgi:Sec7 domain